MNSKLIKNSDSTYVIIPDEYLNELGWQVGDDVQVETSTDCYDWGEVTSLVISNNRIKENERKR